jgi:hypothetical protein
MNINPVIQKIRRIIMIKITKPGQKEFHGFCDRCGCEFTYELVDLKLSAMGNKVNCPTCGKDYHHPAMVQNPTIPGGIGYQWPSDSTDPCAGCVWRSNLEQGGVYIGDTPCTWCNKNRFNVITAEQPSLKDYTTPCVNQLDTYLTTSTSSEHSNVKAYNKTENKEDITQGTVMQTILNACNSATSSCGNCGDTEGRNSCSGEHKCSSKKNCKGKH